MKEGAQPRQVIIVSAPAMIDPAAVLFAEGIKVNERDELFSVETPGNAGLHGLQI